MYVLNVDLNVGISSDQLTQAITPSPTGLEPVCCPLDLRPYKKPNFELHRVGFI